MHMATLIDASMFAIRLDDEPATRDDVLPGWGPGDRLGIVVREPFGSLGASLLIQLAVTAFYDAAPARRDAEPQYPEIYLFHVGGRFGDHRPFDFWPPRKEVFVADDPLKLIEALNDRAITFLTLPQVPMDGSKTDAALEQSGAPWSEQNSFRERTKSVILYSPDGRVDNGNMTINGRSDVLEHNGERTANPGRSLEWFQQLRQDQLPTALPGPGTLEQTQFWAHTLIDRFHEVDATTRAEANRRRVLRLVEGLPQEIYHRTTPQEALGFL